MRVTFCCFFHEEIGKTYLHTKTCFPKTQEKGNGETGPEEGRNGGNIQPEDVSTEKQAEEIQLQVWGPHPA